MNRSLQVMRIRNTWVPMLIFFVHAVLVMAVPAVAQIVLNGSFESGFDNWSATGNVGVWGSEGASHGLVAALFNAGDEIPNGVVSQAIATVLGGSYTVEFDWGAFGANSQVQIIKVEAIGNVVLSTNFTSDSSTIPNTFVHDSMTFVADSETTTLIFTDYSGSTMSVDGALDNIIVTGPPVSTAVDPSLVPFAGRLGPNVPNPFNPQTTIAYDLPKQTTVSLRVFDVSGQLVRVLVDREIATEGRHESIWNGRDETGRRVSSGTYFYRLEAGEYSETRRMALIK